MQEQKLWLKEIFKIMGFIHLVLSIEQRKDAYKTEDLVPREPFLYMRYKRTFQTDDYAT
jgi:hypothetical protein